ncbi:MAG: AI-2E family transporter [Actinobacteria bacterium]|nr:AI-2E family transporter [Actinomycetota bacterium]
MTDPAETPPGAATSEADQPIAASEPSAVGPTTIAERISRAGSVAWAIVGLAAVVALLGLVGFVLRAIFAPLILAGAIVFLLNPVVTRLTARGLPRALSTGIAYLAVVGVIALAAVSIFPLAAEQADGLAKEWPAIERRAERWIEDVAENSQGTFFEFDRSELRDALDGGESTLADQLAQARRIGMLLFHFLLVIVLAPIIAFYLLVDLPHLSKVSRSLVPPHYRAEIELVMRRLNRAIGGFFRGQLAVAVLVGVMVSIGLALIGLRFWFLVGMIAGLFNMIPLIGPWVGGIPGVVIALTTGDVMQAIGVVIVMVVAQQIDNHFITPQVMQRAVSLHPAAVILALLAGGTLGGFFGLLLAVPVAASLKILIGHIWRTHVLGEPLVTQAVHHAVDESGSRTGIVEDVLGERPPVVAGPIDSAAAASGADTAQQPRPVADVEPDAVEGHREDGD